MSKETWIENNLKPDEKYAGIMLGKNGNPDHHLILLPSKAENLNNKEACEWAESIDGELPTRRELALLFANLREEFDPKYHWSGEAYWPNFDYPFALNFYSGHQNEFHKDQPMSARGIRRIAIAGQVRR